MLGSVLAVLLLTQASQSAPATRDEIKEVLKQAETLYYDARFNDSIELLLGLDNRLQKEPNRQQEQIAAKLQLVLAYVGLNRNDQAKVVMRQLYALDKTYSLDPLLFAPKIIALADAAKTEAMTTHCEADRSAVVKSIEKGDIGVVVNRMESIKSDCPDLAGMDSVVVDVLYQRAVESTKTAQYSEALRLFEAVLKLSPNNDLATQYIAIVNNRVQLETERLALQWQKNFAAREFAAATAPYRELNRSASRPLRRSLRESTPIIENGSQTDYRIRAKRVKEAMNELPMRSEPKLRKCFRNRRSGQTSSLSRWTVQSYVFIH